METIDELLNTLKRHRGLNLSVANADRSVELTFVDGDKAWLMNDDDEWTVGFDGWHDHFTSLRKRKP